jgi:twinkle protein
MDAGQVARRLAERSEEIAAYLLPGGKRLGREWCAGSVTGEVGQSLKVCIAGTKAGVWSDFATGEKGDLLDLWCAVRGYGLSEALTEARAYLGVPAPEKKPPRAKSYRKPESPKGLTKPKSRVMDYLKGRGLTEGSLNAYQVGEVPDKGKERGPWIVFPFIREEELVFTKFLHVDRDGGKKRVRAEADCEPILFGMQVIPDNQRFLAITEGEIDAISLFEYGMSAVSVPFGGGTGDKHRWIETCWEWLERFSEIFLVMDADAEGQAAGKDIAHRLGLHRCKVVTLPKKDANECLQARIPKEEILRCFQEADTFDPEELKPASAYTEGVISRFHPSGGQRPGIDLPWQKTQGRIRLYAGETSIWTGTNGHGKSLLLGQVMLGALEQGTPSCIASFEMHPERTLGRMVQQWTRDHCPSPDRIRQAMAAITESVWIFDLVGTAKRDRLLEVFRYAFHRYGVRQFVIDSLSKCGLGDDDYNGQKAFIDTLGDFAKSTGAHVHLVAHARKGADEFSPPGKMDVKGTGALTDMVDNVLCVHRNKAKERDLAIIDNGGSIKGKTRAGILQEYDAFLCCDKHREDGADAEGMYGLYFDRQAQLYVEERT